MGFEPTRAKPNGLAGRRLNHSATVSCCYEGMWKKNITSKFFFDLLELGLGLGLGLIEHFFIWKMFTWRTRIWIAVPRRC